MIDPDNMFADAAYHRPAPPRYGDSAALLLFRQRYFTH